MRICRHYACKWRAIRHLFVDALRYMSNYATALLFIVQYLCATVGASTVEYTYINLGKRNHFDFFKRLDFKAFRIFFFKGAGTSGLN